MTIKSLLLGSAAALVAVSGARAADAVVIPEPELVEYVRVCDTYGTGFFFIPGTETCLSISGYVRYEINVNDDDRTAGNGNLDGEDDWGKRSEFRLVLDARNETELGTLRSVIRIDRDNNPRSTNVTVDRAFIQLAGFTIGQQLTYWDWGFGADGDGLVDFGPGAVGMIAYTVNAGGFAFTLAAEEDEDGDYAPDVVFDVDGAIGDLALRAGVAYNESQEAFTAKIYGAYDFGVATVGLGYQYSDEDQLGTEYLAGFEHVLGADIAAGITDKLSARAGFNYGIDDAAGEDGYTVGAGINYVVVEGFDIDARVNYAGGDAFEGTDNGEGWGGRIRFTRSF
ncbi:MAG: porin [Pseudomonadota bacterium]